MIAPILAKKVLGSIGEVETNLVRSIFGMIPAYYSSKLV